MTPRVQTGGRVRKVGNPEWGTLNWCHRFADGATCLRPQSQSQKIYPYRSPSTCHSTALIPRSILVMDWFFASAMTESSIDDLYVTRFPRANLSGIDRARWAVRLCPDH